MRCLSNDIKDKLKVLYETLKTTPAFCTGLFLKGCILGCPSTWIQSEVFEETIQFIQTQSDEGKKHCILYMSFKPYFQGNFLYFWICKCSHLNAAFTPFECKCVTCSHVTELNELDILDAEALKWNYAQLYSAEYYPNMPHKVFRLDPYGPKAKDSLPEMPPLPESPIESPGDAVAEGRELYEPLMEPEEEQKEQLSPDLGNDLEEYFRRKLNEIFRDSIRIHSLTVLTDEHSEEFYAQFQVTQLEFVKLKLNSKKLNSKQRQLGLVRKYEKNIGVIEIPQRPEQQLANGISFRNNSILFKDCSAYILRFHVRLV